MGSGSSGGSTATTNVPWGPQGSQYQKLYDFASPLLGQQLQYYPGSTVADRSPWQQQANQQGAQQALGGSPFVQAGQQNALQTQQGQFLTPDSNPYLRNTFDTASEDVTRAYMRTVMPNIESRFGGAGRGDLVNNPTQSPRPTSQTAARNDAQAGLSDSLSQMAANLYGGNYQQERGRQLQGQALIPGLRTEDYRDVDQLRQSGRDEFAYSQIQLDDLISRFNFAQQEPYQRGQGFQSLISQPGGGYGSSFGSGGQSSSPGALQYAGLGTSALGLIGSLLGSVVPGVGTAAGGLGGSALGATLGYGASIF